jgi:hypothetical protein
MAVGGLDACRSNPMTPEYDALRAERFEVHDSAGHLRAVFGQLDNKPGSGDIFGVSLRSPDGSERVALTLDDTGPALVFLTDGNIAVQIGVNDAVLPHDHVGAYVVVADGAGTPLLRLWVAGDGSLHTDVGP